MVRECPGKAHLLRNALVLVFSGVIQWRFYCGFGGQEGQGIFFILRCRGFCQRPLSGAVLMFFRLLQSDLRIFQPVLDKK